VKLSTRSEYACLALIDLAQHRDEPFVTTPAIAERQGVPRQYLEQILLILKRSGYVRSRRGTGGGYRLARDPASISMAEIIRLLDGALAPVESVSRYFYEPTPISRNPELLEVFREIRDFVSDKLERTTFADLAGRDLPPAHEPTEESAE
jgi:Rrf2 family transcriptional regulator, cysteine metabolism repressor